MRNETIEDIIKRISRDDIYNCYITDGLSKYKCGKRLGVCEGTVVKLLNHYGIVKSDEQQSKQKSENLSKNRGKLFQETLLRISEEELNDLYINQNKSYDFLRRYYNITTSMLDKVLNHYNIHKSRKQSSALVLETKYNQYGGKEAYDKMADEKSKKTKIEKYGSLEECYKTIQEKVTKTYEEKYGSRRYYNREGARKTCRERYGVDAPCMLPQARMRGNNSTPNRAFAELLDKNGVSYEREFSLEKYSYDFKVGNILIEIDPTATHNSTWNPFGNLISKTYHADKSNCAREHGYRCIHIFDWDNKEKIINLLKDGRETIYARNCEVRDVNSNIASQFINAYHLQNDAKCSIRLGLYYNDDLVSIMTFDKPRYNTNFDFEIIRYCSKANVIGGADKLFNHFCRRYPNVKIISYCDLSKFSGNTYESLGFIRASLVNVSKHWYNQQTGEHITDNLLRQRGFDQLFNESYGKGTSNEQLMLEHGFVEIYDCGQVRYEYIRK